MGPQFDVHGLRSAWQSYCAALLTAGENVLQTATDDPQVDLAEGLRMLTRLQRYGLEGGLEFADANFPVFYQPSHETLKISSDNPDTFHLMASIRADVSYRIRGTRGGSDRLIFTTLGQTAQGPFNLQTSLSSNELVVGADGALTIEVGGERRGANWLAVLPGAHSLLVRAIFSDRQRQEEPNLRIERAGDAQTPPCFDAAQLIGGLQRASRMATTTADAMQVYLAKVLEHGWVNRFGTDPKLWGAGDPGAQYSHGTWRLAPDEALSIEFTPPQCSFWNLQINNRWAESLDYRYHSIHLNRRSAVVGADGVVRVTIAHKNPGMPNWLDTAGHTGGMMVARWIDAATVPKIVCRVTKFVELGSVK